MFWWWVGWVGWVGVGLLDWEYSIARMRESVVVWFLEIY
jgi:hypothetical protein